jgi:uncharacterized membrane protein (UPF0182 family)
VTNVPQNASSSGKRIEPLYVLTRLPGQEKEEFLILRPFVPVSKGNSQNRLASFMVARADPESAPRLESLEMPTGLTVAGPVQVYRTINNTAAISKQFSLLDQQGSRVLQGSIQIIPVKDSLLYVQPVYVLSENGQQPAFRNVIVYYGGSAAIGKTLQGALVQFPAFRDLAPTPDPGETPEAPTTPAEATVDALLRRASTAYAEAQQALKDQDLARYQQQVEELGGILEDLADARAKEEAGAPSTGSSTSSSSSTTSTTRARGTGTQAAGPRR